MRSVWPVGMAWGRLGRQNTYDANGNRVVANGNTYTTGTNNELTSDGDYTYTYDAEGNRISKTNTSGTERELYTWDYRNRLTTVTKQTYDTTTATWTTIQIVEYAYDYNNIWIRKVIGDSKTIFIPENYQTTVQIDNDTTTHHYLWTPNQQDKLLADTTTSGILWALTDHLGTIRDVLDGNSSTHLIYDAFGNIVSGINPLLFGYTGKAFDPATNLQNNINRWYDPSIGRWLSTDPIGFNGNDTNLYCYVENQNLKFIDPYGLSEITLTGMCKIFFFVGHGWPANFMIQEIKGVTNGNGSIINSFGDFYDTYKDEETDMVYGGVYFGMLGCWSQQNIYDGWVEGEAQQEVSRLLNILVSHKPIKSIPQEKQIPDIPSQNTKMKYEDVLKQMNVVIPKIGQFANRLCANRQCFKDDGTPESYLKGEQYGRCDSIQFTFIIDEYALKVLRKKRLPKYGLRIPKVYKLEFTAVCKEGKLSIDNSEISFENAFNNKIRDIKAVVPFKMQPRR